MCLEPEKFLSPSAEILHGATRSFIQCALSGRSVAQSAKRNRALRLDCDGLSAAPGRPIDTKNMTLFSLQAALVWRHCDRCSIRSCQTVVDIHVFICS